MKVIIAIIVFVVSTVWTQEIVEVNCGSDSILVRFSKEIAVNAGYKMKDLYLNEVDCAFDGEKDGYYTKTINLSPLSCGTEVVINDTQIIYKIKLSSVNLRSEYPIGIIIAKPPSPPFSALIECAYDLKPSVAFFPDLPSEIDYNYFEEDVRPLDFKKPDPTTPPAPKVRRLPDFKQYPNWGWIGPGIYRIEMNIYKTSAYKKIYAYGPPVIYDDEFVYFGISLVDKTQKDLYVLIKRCWATMENNTESELYYDLIENSCPSDDAFEESVKVTQNGVGQMASWHTKVFYFINGTNAWEASLSWVHCDVSFCVNKACPVDCSASKQGTREGQNIKKGKNIITARLQNEGRPSVQFDI